MKKFTKIVALVLVFVLAVAVLVACNPKANPQKAQAKLKKKGYITEVTDGQDDVQAFLAAVSKDGKNIINVTYYKTKDAAKKHWDELNSHPEQAEQLKRETGQAYDIDPSQLAIKLHGKTIYVGTKAAIRAAS